MGGHREAVRAEDGGLLTGGPVGEFSSWRCAEAPEKGWEEVGPGDGAAGVRGSRWWFHGELSHIPRSPPDLVHQTSREVQVCVRVRVLSGHRPGCGGSSSQHGCVEWAGEVKAAGAEREPRSLGLVACGRGPTTAGASAQWWGDGRWGAFAGGPWRHRRALG